MILNRNYPKVSVCIPTWNRVDLLKESIDSVLAQTFEDYELIISDNASTDGTEDLVMSYGDSRIFYSRNEQNIGVIKNINRCYALARGKYITIFPDDDVMMPDNLAVKVQVLNIEHRVGLVHSNYHVIDQDGQVVMFNTNWRHGPDQNADAVSTGHEVLKTMLLNSNTINLPTVMIKRKCYDSLGGFTEKLCHASDWEYWMRIAVHYDIALIAKPLVKWRVFSGTLTTANMLGKSGKLTYTYWKEYCESKRLIINKYGGVLQDGDMLDKCVCNEIAYRITEIIQEIFRDNGFNLNSFHFVSNWVKTFPEVLALNNIGKLAVKCLLPRKILTFLKN